jgi:DNA-binding NtrC family response regulator
VFDGFKVIFVEDDAPVRTSLTQTLELAGFQVCPCGSAEEAQRHVTFGLPGIVITDLRLPGDDGLVLLTRVKEIDAAIPVILVTAHGDVSMAVQAMRAGAYDFIEKPYTSKRLVEVATRALEKRALGLEVATLRRQLDQRRGIDAVLLGNSPAMEQLRRDVLHLAGTSADVMIVGETGTGKELVARCLHDHSARRERQFVAINCGALPETLLESELFGHEVGAFTNASKRRIGKIEYANGGTLLLDEIESMPPAFQVKLLRVLQERKLERLGSNEQIHVDVRVLAATKADLGAHPTFRNDLYYRLQVAVLELPPLRERREDIPLLFEHFVFDAAARHGGEPPGTIGAQLRELMSHDWPGNVRELRNAAERFVLGLRGARTATTAATLARQMERFEKTLIEQALREHQGQPAAASEALGIARRTLYDKIAQHGIDLEEYRLPPRDASS